MRTRSQRNWLPNHIGTIATSLSILMDGRWMVEFEEVLMVLNADGSNGVVTAKQLKCACVQYGFELTIAGSLIYIERENQ